MDKSWIALGCTVDGRISQPYYDGVISFLHFAMAVIDRDGKILCPCRKCVNVVRQNFQIVQIHLLQHGIISTYTIWHVHGEPRESKCGQSLSTHTDRLQIQYLNLKSAKGEEYARSHPPPECDLEKWKNLIEGKWNDTNRMKQSQANIDDRKQLKTKHRCGSKSLPIRLKNKKNQTITNGGQLPELPCVYKSTHFNDVTKQWISPECEKNYDNMIKIQAEHCSQPDVVPTTPEELSVKLLKPRSGYVKGLGLRPSFSVRTTSASTNSDYVRHLQMEIQEQNEEITTQKHEIQAQKEEIQAQNIVIGKMNESIEEHLEMTLSIMEFLQKQGFKGQFRGGGIP